ncbi:hypothetical protein ACTU3I_09975 [Microbacterium sp. RD1]|uniref:hypothetical protein n=1 Tax=Microbacterium sp. RD1 TaxID=3457313 RepID=UPI003FA582DC
MSSPSRRRQPLEVRERETCMCASGGRCTSFARGHALHLIQLRLAAATPSEWIDAVVESADDATGEIALRTLAEGSPLVVWHAAGVELAPGEPVALHRRYAVLSARGGSRNVAVLD